MHPIIRLTPMTVACALLFAFVCGRAMAQDPGGIPPQLQVAIEGDTLSCHLTGLPAGSGAHWILQSSAGLNSWEDLLFFDKGGEAVVAIPPGGQERQFLRARRIEADDPVLRDFLNARNTWRRAGIDDYTIEVRWGSSWFFWHGTVTVRDHEVISAVPIDTNFAEPPAQRTIDGWFAHLESFIDPRADRIDVTFDPVFGYTRSSFVDIELWIADEEQSWSILDFQPQR